MFYVLPGDGQLEVHHEDHVQQHTGGTSLWGKQCMALQKPALCFDNIIAV